MKRGSVMQLINEVTKHQPKWADVKVVNDAEEEYDYLIDRIDSLETALKCASACNMRVSNERAIWGQRSMFQNKIEELVGKPPYGDKDGK